MEKISVSMDEREKNYRLNELFYSILNELRYQSRNEYIKELSKAQNSDSAIICNNAGVKYKNLELKLIWIEEEFKELTKH